MTHSSNKHPRQTPDSAPNSISSKYASYEVKYPLLRYPRQLFQHFFGVTAGNRSKFWIFWLASSIAGLIAAIINPSMWIPTLLLCLYTYYLYRGGHFVLRPTWWLICLIIALPIFAIYQHFDDKEATSSDRTSTQQTRSDASSTAQPQSTNTVAPSIVNSQQNQKAIDEADTVAGVVLDQNSCAETQKDTDPLPNPSDNGAYLSSVMCNRRRPNSGSPDMLGVTVYASEKKRTQAIEFTANAHNGFELRAVDPINGYYPALIFVRYE